MQVLALLLAAIANAQIPTCGGSSQKTCAKGLACVIPGGNTIGLCLTPSQLSATNTITDGPSPTVAVNGTAGNSTSVNATTTIAQNTTALPTTTTTTGPPPSYPTVQPNSGLTTGAGLAVLAVLIAL
ncbi:hypothetical protein HDV01_007584 [Terramyces sp. JEL0728]|nr:hypothetical protein HDV01_007584 [Terramyces sp. JEL0728]